MSKNIIAGFINTTAGKLARLYYVAFYSSGIFMHGNFPGIQILEKILQRERSEKLISVSLSLHHNS